MTAILSHSDEVSKGDQMIQMTRAHGQTDLKRPYDITVCVGAQAEGYTELHLLGLYDGTPVHGRTLVQEGRSEYDAEICLASNGQRFCINDVRDLIRSLFATLDAEPKGIIAQEMDRIRG